MVLNDTVATIIRAMPLTVEVRFNREFLVAFPDAGLIRSAEASSYRARIGIAKPRPGHVAAGANKAGRARGSSNAPTPATIAESPSRA